MAWYLATARRKGVSTPEEGWGEEEGERMSSRVKEWASVGRKGYVAGGTEEGASTPEEGHECAMVVGRLECNGTEQG
jgi:hypothetical protein